MQAATFPQGVLTLDDDHVYRLDGAIIPGNTQILKDMGIVDTTYYNMDAAWRGTYVHEATALYDKYDGDFHWPSVDSRYEGFVRGWASFVAASGFKAERIEELVLGVGPYGTTIDRMGVLNGRHVVLEIKTGTCPKWVGLQTAMQLEACVGVGWCTPRTDRLAVELKSDGKYRVVECRDIGDKRKAMALVTAWWTRNEYRGDVPW